MRTIYDWRPKLDELPTRKRSSFPDIIDDDFWRFYDIGKRYSMLQVSGFYNLYSSLRYVSTRNIPGDIIECGVFLGGASIFAALVKNHFDMNKKRVLMYDTYAGFPPDSYDVKDGKRVKGPSYKSFLEAVQANTQEAGVARADVDFIEGPIEETLLSHPLPDTISLLRLDTDFYSSTKAEMEILYPRLATNGVLLVDDYGTYEGSRRAVDEALSEKPLLLTRIDKGIRCAIKI